jgi:gliding motility-associated-like protein
MWGPNGAPFNLDFDWELFHVEWDTSAGFSQMTTIFGDSIGVAFEAGTWGEIGSTFSMHGFTTGYVDVDYPVEINLTFPDHYSFELGEWITINSDFEVLPGWDLTTHYPSAGVTTWDMDFGFGANIDFITCLPFQDCDTLHIIPPINIPTDSITIFHLNGQTGYTVYPCIDSTGAFHFCEDTILPIIIPDWFNIGLTGSLTLPYVETEDWLDSSNKCLYASGDSAWLFLNLDIIQFIYALAGLIPPPNGTAIQQAIGYLSGSYTFDVLGSTAIVEWDLLSADMGIMSTNQQDFTFCPNIWCTFSLPVAVEWNVTNPNDNNTIVNSGFSDTIRFRVENNVHLKYPCFTPENMNVGIEYDFTNDFTNHTWDSISFDFMLTALWFHFYLPTKQYSDYEMPEFCVKNIISQNEVAVICSDVVSTSGLIESYETKDLDYEIGPLIDLSIPLGYFPLTWYNNTWDLAGFVQDTTFSGTTLIPNYNPIQITDITGDDILCFGESTGGLSISIAGGVPAYEYSWSNGELISSTNTICSIDSLPLGNYMVTITDYWECSLDTSFTLVELNPEIALVMSATDVLCHGDYTGTAEVNVSGGSPPYSYLWSNGQTNAAISAINAGSYIVTITDAIGCIKTDSIYVDEPPTHVETTIVASHVVCFGENNGFANLTAFDGTPGYSYLWSNGSTTQDIDALFAGQYFVTVTDANNCITIDTVEILEPDLLTAEVIGTDVSCYGLSDGSIDLSVSGGVSPYAYVWNNAANSQDLTGLFAGTYTVTVTDSHDCLALAQYTIEAPIAELAINGNTSNVRCFGGNDGNINISVTGGTTPYSFIWTNGAISEDLINISSGYYGLTVADSHNCVVEQEFNITQPASPIDANIIATNVQCYNGDDGFADLSVIGGTPPYSYYWSNGFIAQDAPDLQAGSYSVTITDFNNCMFEHEVTIHQPELLSASINGNNIACFNGSDGNVDLTVTGGTVPYSFNWNNGSVSEDLNNVSSGYYSVTITDNNNCKTYSNIALSQPSNPMVSSINPTHVSCFDGNDGHIKLNVSGGSPVYTYLWSNGQTSRDIFALMSGWYYVTITDSHNCIRIDSIFIDQPDDAISLTFSLTHNKCFNQAIGSVDLSAQGGTPGYVYIWSNGNMNEDIHSLSAGLYSVTVLDSKYCMIADSLVITQPEKLLLPDMEDTTICHGQSILLASPSAHGGTLPYMYYWSNGVSGQNLAVQPFHTSSYSIYSVDANGCISNTSDINVHVHSPINMSLESFPSIVCEGKEVEIVANVTGGGGPPYTTIFMGDTSNSVVFSIVPLQTQVYSVIVYDVCLHSLIERNIEVNIQSLPQAAFSVDKYSGCVPLEVQFSSDFQNQDYNYSWSFGDNQDNMSDLPVTTHTYHQSGVFSVSLTVTSNFGCSKTIEMSNLITTYPIPEADFMAQPYATSITNPEIQFWNNSINNSLNSWDFGDGQTEASENPKHSYSKSGNFEVVLWVQSAQGCWDSTTNVITIYDEYVFYAPDAFSPDGDGLNEIFRVYGSGIKSEKFMLSVYDRWGELIFYSTDIQNGWDGIAKNGKHICKPGTYTWITRYYDSNNNEHQEAGTVTLIR